MNDREESINREIESGKWSYIMIPAKDVRLFIGHAEMSPDGCDEIRIKPDAKLAFIESEEEQ